MLLFGFGHQGKLVPYEDKILKHMEERDLVNAFKILPAETHRKAPAVFKLAFETSSLFKEEEEVGSEEVSIFLSPSRPY